MMIWIKVKIKMQKNSAISLSPSFNSYSNTKLAEIAARVVQEFASEEELHEDEFYSEREENSVTPHSEEVEGDTTAEYVDGDDGFEFAFVPTDSDFPSPISADEIFQNGQIRPVYPVFNRDLFLQSMEFQAEEKGDTKEDPALRLPLRELFNEERESAMTMRTTSSCSSSDADELDGIPEESYCVWRPKEAEGRCRKSSSAGSNSKRWRIKDLLSRSHSEGSSKDDFVISSHSNGGGKKKQNENRGRVTPVSSGRVKPAAASVPFPVVGAEKRRTYLPYRQDLVWFFGNVNGLSKNLQPF